MKNNRQTNEQTNTATQTAVDKKESKKIPRFAFLKISFADTHLAHLLLFNFYFFLGRAKAKEPNFSNAKYSLTLK